MKDYQLDADAHVPLYYQIKQFLKKNIQEGVLSPEQIIPSERLLCERFGVSRPTVRQAVQELINEGLLERRRGVGTFVSRPKIRQQLGLTLGFTDRMHQEGRQPSTRLLEKSVVKAGSIAPEIAQNLQLESDETILILERLRLADGQPLMVEKVHLPLGRFPGLEKMDFEENSLYHLLRTHFEVEVKGLTEIFEPVLLNAQQALLLEAEANRPAMRMLITTFDAQRQPVEYNIALSRADCSHYYIHIDTSDSEPHGNVHLKQAHLELSL